VDSTQIDKILEQLPEGTQILRVYQAFEGDIRIIIRIPGESFERRYTVIFNGDYPSIKEMP
jgi:hypothetical protein